jgi:cobalt/nickel transport system ATP-binding protein
MSHRRLIACGLTHRYRHAVDDALADCSADIEPGSRVALLGANGCGKTTLLLHLNGSLRPQAGTVSLGNDVQRHDRKGLIAWRREVGLIVQDPDDMLIAGTVRQEISFGPLNIGRGETDARRDVDQILDELSLTHLGDQPTHLLSGGERHRVAIAAVAVIRPSVLLLDEPTAGLDPLGVAEVLDVLSRLQDDGTSIVMSTHDIDLAYGWADQVVVMAAGRVIRSGEPIVLHDDTTVVTARLQHPAVLTVWRSLPDTLRPAVCPATIELLAAEIARRSDTSMGAS